MGEKERQPGQCFVTERLGLISYAAGWEIQKRYHQEIAAGDRPPTLLLLEHTRTITLGRSSKPSSLLLTEEAYRQRGFEVHHVERGGDVTYHGPGQLVGYPLFRIEEKVGDFLRQIENALLSVVRSYSIQARPNPGYAGLWAKRADGGEAKLAAIGVAIFKRVSMHGFAMNVDPDLNDFRLIVPCGIQGAEATSLRELLGEAPLMEVVSRQIEDAFLAEFGMRP
jgi:lipoyl(octanoyl) transferase